MTIFEKIITGEIPAAFAYKDEKCVAIMDIHPVNPGHVLVIPRQPIPNWHEMDEQLSAHLFKISGIIGSALQKIYQPEKDSTR